MRIEDAWAVTGGQGAVIADIDTGIRDNNPQLADWQRYTVSESGGSSPTGNTKHGTHQAGVIGAARDGSCVVGVAYGATHISVKHSNDIADVNTWRVTAALDTAVAHGAKVISMPFRSDNDSNEVGDRLEMYYSGTDATGRRYDILFIAAAGSGWATTDALYGVIFPAKHPDVIAVSAIDYDTNQLHSGSHHGDEVELSAYQGQPTTGDLEEGYCSATSGNTSNASSIVAGIAALVRARYPAMTNAEVRTKLRRGVHDLGPVGRDIDYGYGIINAYAAIGGFYQIKMFASHNQANPCVMYTNISSRRCYYNYETHGCMVETFRAVAYGDGPFTYRWADGSTPDSKDLTICPSYLPGYDYSLSVTVTDTNLHRSATLDLSIDAKPSDLQDPKIVKPTEPAVGA